MNATEIAKLQTYLQKLFSNDALEVKARVNLTDSVEVFLKGEHIGLIYKDEDEGETSYDFQMAILDFDLE
ncbi:MAG: DUF3126 family protein [Rhizobiales bacterium]|nr:DUF3126 family protein [Hyphomicrobiales bacterium]